jgi:hypothetical protein
VGLLSGKVKLLLFFIYKVILNRWKSILESPCSCTLKDQSYVQAAEFATASWSQYNLTKYQYYGKKWSAHVKPQVINHGLPDEVISNFRKDMAEFFKQPLEAKKVYSMTPGNLQGYGQHFVVSENQKLDWADLFCLVLRPIDSRDMKFWPSHPPSFRFA